MSILIAVAKADQVALASDSVHFFGTRREVTTNLIRQPKVRTLGRFLLGAAGASIYDTLLDRYLVEIGDPPDLSSEVAILGFFVDFWKFIRSDLHFVDDQPATDEHSQFARLEAHFLIASRDSIFTVDSDFTVMRFRKWCGIGSGVRYAFGAIHALYDRDISARDIAHAAVAAAIDFDESCGGEIEVITPP